MTLVERKQQLIERLETVFEESIIDEIEQLLNKKQPKDVLYFPSELKGKIDEALEQMRTGKVLTEEEMDKFFEQWLVEDEK